MAFNLSNIIGLAGALGGYGAGGGFGDGTNYLPTIGGVQPDKWAGALGGYMLGNTLGQSFDKNPLDIMRQESKKEQSRLEDANSYQFKSDSELNRIRDNQGSTQGERNYANEEISRRGRRAQENAALDAFNNAQKARQAAIDDNVNKFVAANNPDAIGASITSRSNEIASAAENAYRQNFDDQIRRFHQQAAARGVGASAFSDKTMADATRRMGTDLDAIRQDAIRRAEGEKTFLNKQTLDALNALRAGAEYGATQDAFSLAQRRMNSNLDEALANARMAGLTGVGQQAMKMGADGALAVYNADRAAAGQNNIMAAFLLRNLLDKEKKAGIPGTQYPASIGPNPPNGGMNVAGAQGNASTDSPGLGYERWAKSGGLPVFLQQTPDEKEKSLGYKYQNR